MVVTRVGSYFSLLCPFWSTGEDMVEQHPEEGPASVDGFHPNRNRRCLCAKVAGKSKLTYVILDFCEPMM